MNATNDIRKLLVSSNVITFGVTKYLLTKGEVNLTDEKVRQRMVDIMSAEHYREQGWHPSTLTHCKRAQVFEHIGVSTVSQHGAELMNLFADGTWRHLRWQTMLMTAGILDDVEVPIRTKDGLVGSIDGIGTDKNGTVFLFELKGIYSLNNNLPYPEHINQVQSYLYGYPDAEYAVIVYEDKRTQHWKEYRIERSAAHEFLVRRKLRSLNKYLNTKELPDVREDCSQKKGAQFKQCAYAHTCNKLKSWSEAEQPAQANDSEDPF